MNVFPCLIYTNSTTPLQKLINNIKHLFRNCRSQMFFKIGVLQNTCVSFSRKTCDFIQKRIQHRCFLVDIANFLRTAFLMNTSCGCFCKFSQKQYNMHPSRPIFHFIEHLSFTFQPSFYSIVIFSSSHPLSFFSFQATPATLLKKRLWHRCFPVNFANFLRTAFLKEHFWWLLLFMK